MPVSSPLTSDQFDGRLTRRNGNGDDARYCDDGGSTDTVVRAEPVLVDCGLLLPCPFAICSAGYAGDMPRSRAWMSWNCPVVALPCTRSDPASRLMAS